MCFFTGRVQPAVQASEWDKLLVPADYTETSSSNEPYKDLLEKMKERRAARKKKTLTVKAEETKSDEGPSMFSSPFFSPAPLYTPPAPPAATVDDSKTHGFLSHFLAHFLLLVATLGGGFVLLTTPDSKWEERQKTVHGLVAMVTPVVEDSWSKVQPVYIQAQE